MGALAAIAYFDPSAQAGSAGRGMMNAMAGRAPDGIGDWSRGPAALSHGALHTTPEAAAEPVPLEARDGALAITAVARLDNRAELLRELDLSPSTGDARLILAAYERWNQHCPERLLGDFAFAIWDATRHALFCACDRFAVRRLHWYRSASLAAVATEVKGLLSLEEVPRRLNETRVADLLCLQLDDQTATAFQHVHRLPPAHALTVDSRGARLRRYWELDARVAWTGGTDSDYEEAFRATFAEAVRSRMRTTGTPAALLSGGLDSSSVAVVARHVHGQAGAQAPLDTISARFSARVPGGDEREFIEAVLSLGAFRPHFVHPEEFGPLDDWIGAPWRGDEPELPAGIALGRALYAATAELGVRCLLDGLGGDFVVSHGGERLTELAMHGRILSLLREARALGAADYASTGALLRQFVVSPFVPEPLRRLRRQQRDRHADSPHWAKQMPLNRELVHRLSLDERYAALVRDSVSWPLTPRQMQRSWLTAGVVPFGLAAADRLAAAFGVEPRYPFLDSRLVELCLAIPPSQKLRSGYSRDVMRRALADLLPPEIRWRTGKGRPGASPAFALTPTTRTMIDRVIVDDGRPIGNFVDLDRVRTIYRGCRETPGHPDWWIVFRAAATALWFEHAEARFDLS